MEVQSSLFDWKSLFLFFNLEINQRGSLTAESRVACRKVKPHRLKIMAQAMQGLFNITRE